MIRNILFVGMFLLSSMLFASCIGSCFNCIDGSGAIVTQNRERATVNGFVIKGSSDVFLTQGPEQSIIVETDDNIIEKVKTYEEDGLLIIETGDMVCPTKLNIYLTLENINDIIIKGSGNVKFMSNVKTGDIKIKINGSGDIQAKSLYAYNSLFKINGSGNIRVEMIETENLESDINGSGDIKALEGSAKNSIFDIAGSGNIDFYNVKSENVKAESSGSGNIKSWAEQKMEAKTAGSGDIYYKGSPEATSFKVRGSGKIKKR